MTDTTEEPIHVCQFLNSLGDGGVQNLLLNMVALEDDADVTYSLCYLRELETTTASQFRSKGIQLYHIGDQSPYSPHTVVSLRRLIDTHDIDVVHAHLPLQHVFARLACASTDTSVISTHHNLGDNSHPVVLAAEEATRRWDAATVAVSKAVQDRYTSRWPFIKTDQWKVVPNGIDVQQFRATVRSSATTTEEGTTFLHVGRYIPSKAQSDLLSAFSAVLEESPDSQLYLVGWGELEEALISTATQLGIADSVTVTGYQSEIEKYYARADVFVSSSRSEGFPITYLEAMAAELPIVTTSFAGATDIVADGETGLVVPLQDRAKLAAAMQQLTSQPAAQQMGQNGYDRAVELFDITRTAAEYLQLYRAACQRH